MKIKLPDFSTYNISYLNPATQEGSFSILDTIKDKAKIKKITANLIKLIKILNPGNLNNSIYNTIIK